MTGGNHTQHPKGTKIKPQHVLPRTALRAALLLVACAAVPAWGQAGITPGQVYETVPDRRPSLPPTPPQVIVPANRPNAVHDPSAPRFTVNAFTFVGNSVVPERLLKRLLERFIDLQLNLYDLNRAADVVTSYYRANGFPIARAIIPAQKVENGIVRIEVIEGRIGNITVAGNSRYSESTILARTASLPKDQIVTLDRLERSMLLINDLPGLTARATLQPGAEYGMTDMLIRTEEKFAAGSISLDNSGRKETGEYRLDGSFDINNPLGYGDQLSFRAIQSQDSLLSYGRIGYSAPILADGLRAGIAYSKVDYSVGGDFAALGISGGVTNTEVTLSYPYLRSRARNLVFGLGLRHTTAEQTTLGVPTSNTEINLLNASALGSWVHADSSITNATVLFSGNGKKNPFGTRQDAQFAKLDIDVNHLRAASKNWDLFLRGNLVLSRDALADTEKFSLGGPSSVRGYRPSDLRGDRGWLATAELRRQFVLANTVGIFNLFYDQGSAKVSGFPGTNTIRSAGFGVSVFPNKHLRAKAEFAHPLSDQPSNDGKRNRVWFTLTASF